VLIIVLAVSLGVELSQNSSKSHDEVDRQVLVVTGNLCHHSLMLT
jgi:hypothetical protein